MHAGKDEDAHRGCTRLPHRDSHSATKDKGPGLRFMAQERAPPSSGVAGVPWSKTCASALVALMPHSRWTMCSALHRVHDIECTPSVSMLQCRGCSPNRDTQQADDEEHMQHTQ